MDDDVYFTDPRNGMLPQVAFIAPNVFACEHPPASIQWGQSYMNTFISALMASSAWATSAFIMTYDEGGGFFDHVAPPQFDAYGAGLRIPTLVVSPYVRRGYISPTVYDAPVLLAGLNSAVTRKKSPSRGPCSWRNWSAPVGS